MSRIERKIFTLADLREKAGLTQSEMSERMKTGQGNVSKLESRSDVRLSSLIFYVESLGGQLELTAILGDEKLGIGIGRKVPE
jgi:transcriptional regulator with XRE-family HTH domain